MKKKIILISTASVIVFCLINCRGLKLEHEEARNLPLNEIYFTNLNDGTYIGEYEGGMYKWRVCTVEILVTSGKVRNIEMLGTSDPGAENTSDSLLFDRVVKAQSLQVDVISGATLTSKAYLKAVEKALERAQK
ncbi:MAG: FMN-binding protein [Bacteroidales bacterium]|nr:FMN-binding protein [Bacteroidales bacterium]